MEIFVVAGGTGENDAFNLQERVDLAERAVAAVGDGHL